MGCYCNSIGNFGSYCTGNTCCPGSAGNSCSGGGGCSNCPGFGMGFTNLCFVAGTKITMSDNTVKNIEDVEVGDSVLSWNQKTGKLEPSLVKKLIQPIHDDMVELQWEHGTTNNTFDHPFYSVTKNDWVSYKPELTLSRYEFDNVGQLEVGTPYDTLRDIGLFLKDGNLIESKLLSIRENIGEVQTYIFELDVNNTFFANGILTHNKKGQEAPPKSGSPSLPSFEEDKNKFKVGDRVKDTNPN